VLTELLINVSFGALVGLVIGATGVGGGTLMTPLLLFGYGLPLGLAIGTDLVYACFTKLAALRRYAREDSIDWRMVWLLSCGSLPTAAIVLLLWPGLSQAFEYTASRLLGVVLVATALALLLRPWLLRRLRHKHQRNGSAHQLVLVGMMIGAAVALTSVGAGVLGTLALLIIAPTIAVTRLIGSEIAHAIVLTSVGGLGHAWLANVDWMLALSLSAGSIPAAMLGAKLAHHRLNGHLRNLLVVLISLCGLRLALGW